MIKPAELILNCREETEAFFGENSPLKLSEKFGAPKYEERLQQKQMAIKIAEAFEKNKNLCIEAPTGIGKSYAYLVPSIFLSKSKKRPVIISTETINLQEQLIGKDIPLLQKLIPGAFKASLAKGRSHYVCLRRLHFAEEKAREELFEEYVQSGLKKIIRWVSESGQGDRGLADFPIEPSVWYHIACEAGNCSGSKCNFFKDCFYWKVRKEWGDSNIVVTNHALLFTSCKMEEQYEYSLLPNPCAVIFDEAHTLENEAAEWLGLHLSKNGIELFLNKLFDEEKSKGIFFKKGGVNLEIRGQIRRIRELNNVFFKGISSLLDNQKDDTIRFQNPGSLQDIMSEEFRKLAKTIIKASEIEDDENSKQELNSYAKKTESLADAFYDFCNMTLDKHVYWSERNEKNRQIELYAAPLNVNEILSENFFSNSYPIILASATLSVKKELDYFANRVGFKNGDKIILDTVFDYKKQMKLCISKKVPHHKSEDYIFILCEEIKKYIEKTHGKAFVLFTNYSNLRACAENLKPFFDEKQIKLLVHGEESNRTKMIEEFRKDINSVIFGTASFWSGVDVPGESLSNVIIVKLPFLVPSYPLVQARSEVIEKEGGNSFSDYQVPEAILRFRQGVGRLIRTKSDKGIVVVLDSRIITKSYGRAFLESIPECERILD